VTIISVTGIHYVFEGDVAVGEINN